jgi:hypothetical protein
MIILFIISGFLVETEGIIPLQLVSIKVTICLIKGKPELKRV